MKSEGEIRPKWLFGGMLKPQTDFYELLNKQAAKTVEGMQALQRWLVENGDERCQIVRDLEAQADVIKLELERRLVDSFITPFDREDIYDLSACLDEVINTAKSIVREMEAFEVKARENPDLKELAQILVEGTACLASSIANLRTNLPEAARQAQLARKSENRFTKAYRLAMRSLLEKDDIKLIMRVKEVYKTLLLGAERIDRVGEKLSHVIVKMT